jgi:hypothetical protein
MGWEAKEALFVSVLEQLGRPTLGQYARERRNYQKTPAVQSHNSTLPPSLPPSLPLSFMLS